MDTINGVLTGFGILLGLIIAGVLAIVILWIVKGNSAAKIDVEVTSISNDLGRFSGKASHTYAGPGQYSPQGQPLIEATADAVEKAANYKKGELPLIVDAQIKEIESLK